MEERQTYDVPGVGEMKARIGTSTAELAGAASFWSKKYKHAWRDGFVTACVAIGSAGISAAIVIHFFF